MGLMMLALLKNNTVMNRMDILGQFPEGGWVSLPDGSQVSPAYDGWALRGYELHIIQDADPVPAGYQVVSTSLQVVNGLPKLVNSLQQIVFTSLDVDAERDQRIAAGFTYNGVFFQSRQFDLDNIRSMATAASVKIVQGAQDGDLRWFDPEADFYWIAADNSHVQMSAPDMVSFAMVAATWGSKHILAASALKKMTPIPLDFTDNKWWP